jgi:hypothetical protein
MLFCPEQMNVDEVVRHDKMSYRLQLTSAKHIWPTYMSSTLTWDSLGLTMGC